MLQRALGNDAGASIREDGGDDHFPTIGIVISELHIGSETLTVILRVDEAENPHDESPGRGTPTEALLAEKAASNSVQPSGGG